MENGIFEVQRLSLCAGALFAGAKSTKIFYRLGDGLTKETHDDTTATGRPFDFHIKVDLACDLFQVTGKQKRRVCNSGVNICQPAHNHKSQSHRIGSYDDADEETNEMIRVIKEMEAKSFMTRGVKRRLVA